jgi:hypothetical protein
MWEFVPQGPMGPAGSQVWNAYLAQAAKNSANVARFTPANDIKGAALQKVIAETPNKALLVRVTGVQLFDSEHSLGPFHLKRHNNWEIHPVLKLEYCSEERTCVENSDKNWEDMEKPVP